MPDTSNNTIHAVRTAPATLVVTGEAADGDVDLLLLRDSLAMTPWERMLANDDALNFAESLCAAIEERYAKPQ